jgi:hypothetical protein
LENSKLNILLESSGWWLLACCLCGAAYAYILYQKTAPWSGTTNKILAFLRFLLVSLLCLLLLNIFLKSTKNSLQKRLVGLAIDNSASVGRLGKAQIASLKTALAELANRLKDKDIDVEYTSLNSANLSDIDSLKFDLKSSDLGQLISSFKSNNEGRNISDVVLLTDGIANKGHSPASAEYPFAISSIALGDTSSKRDIILKNILANNIVYKGNNFEVQADISGYGFENKQVTASISNSSGLLQAKTTTIKPGYEPSTVVFTVNAKNPGLNRYTISVQPQTGEYNTKNNSRELLVEVIDARQKILLMAAVPHPDIKAIKAILDLDQNYQVELLIANQQKPPVPKEKHYDLAILHQLPAPDGSLATILKTLKDAKTPIFSFLGNQTAIQAINQTDNNLKINNPDRQTDQVTGYFNTSYNGISFDPEALKLLEKLSPITVPFGDITSKMQVILKQKVGNTPTQKPLLLVQNESPKAAYFLGEGIWGWRMEEYALTEKNEVVDNLLLKTIQLVTAKDDTRKLRIYPQNKEIDINESLQLETELYNDVLQKIYGNTINLKLTHEKGNSKNYQYQTSEGNSTFNLTGLQPGLYKYIGTSIIAGKTETSQGEFLVKSNSIELENTQADHQLLQQIASNTGGKVFLPNQLAALDQFLTNKKAPNILQTEENTREIINWPWLLALILLLAALEWGLRKYLGSY